MVEIKMTKNQRANKTIAGYTFQNLAAIVLFIDNFDNLKSIKVEGNKEDIDIQLANGDWKIAQAKMISKPINSTKNYRRRRMYQAFSSLCKNYFDSSERISNIIYVSNCIDPMGELENSQSSFYTIYSLKFDQVAEGTQSRIAKMLENRITNNKRNKEAVLKELKSLFRIQVIPFDPNYSNEDKFSSVQYHVGNFLVNKNLATSTSSLAVMNNWHSLFELNSESYSDKEVLTKKDLLWVVVVIEFNQKFNTDSLAVKLKLDDAIVDSIYDRFENIFDYVHERIEFCSRVWNDESLYESKEMRSLGGRVIYKFINDCWQDYVLDIGFDDLADEENEALVKLALYRILTKKNTIKNIMNMGD